MIFIQLEITNKNKMNRTIKIGFLFPFSTIAPNMSQDIIDGFYSAIPENYRTFFQFYPEYIDKGNHELIKTAINKLIMFHNVDVVSGIISYKLIPEITRLIEQRKKIGFFFDIGEYLPPIQALSENIFFNSLQFWQLEYALGKWAQQQFTGKGAMVLSVYEAGYQMHSAFWQGAMSSGAEEIDMHILPFNPQIKNIEPIVESYLQTLEKQDIQYLHALFCGDEACEFFNAYKKSKLCNKIPLLVSPHMASEEILDNFKDTNMTLYSASGWDYYSNDDKNIKFKTNYQFTSGKKATEFAVMGLEMGLLFGQILSILQKGDTKEIINAIKTARINSPRAERNFNHDISLSTPAINIEKISTHHNHATKIVVDQGKALHHNHSTFNEIHSQSISGWKNPYLCI